MRNFLKVAAAVVAVAGTMSVAGRASATSTANGVFFVHGTGDYTKPSTSFNPTDGTAVTDYWMKFSIDKIRTAPDGTKWNYGVAGYQGAGTDAMTSAYEVGKQLMAFYRSYSPLLNVVVVTHSNGSNPMRYLLAHPTAQILDTNGTYVCAAKMTGGTCNGTTYPGFVKRVVMTAGDNAGTPLADKVTSSGTAASIGNSMLTFFGGSSWNNAAVRQQIQANMSTYNGNGTFATNSAPGAVSSTYIYGSNVYAVVTSGDASCGWDTTKPDCTASCAWYDVVCGAKKAACQTAGAAGGYAITAALAAAQLYGWGSTSAPTDGFIGTNSSTAFGSDPNGFGGDSRLNHNQSRRSCHGSDTRIAAHVHGAMGSTFGTIPPDYNVSPAAQACNATTQGWQTASPYAGNFYWYGCTSSMSSDSNTDFDCQSALGGDNGNVLPASQNPGTLSAYFNTSYYSGSSGCSDTWLGDGECDLCLLAKYGYDAAPGSNAADDCVNYGTGHSNSCADLAYYDQAGAIGYYSYTATH